jgi:hypothetical protein
MSHDTLIGGYQGLPSLEAMALPRNKKKIILKVLFILA